MLSVVSYPVKRHGIPQRHGFPLIHDSDARDTMPRSRIASHCGTVSRSGMVVRMGTVSHCRGVSRSGTVSIVVDTAEAGHPTSNEAARATDAAGNVPCEPKHADYVLFPAATTTDADEHRDDDLVSGCACEGELRGCRGSGAPFGPDGLGLEILELPALQIRGRAAPLPMHCLPATLRLDLGAD